MRTFRLNGQPASHFVLVSTSSSRRTNYIVQGFLPAASLTGRRKNQVRIRKDKEKKAKNKRGTSPSGSTKNCHGWGWSKLKQGNSRMAPKKSWNTWPAAAQFSVPARAACQPVKPWLGLPCPIYLPRRSWSMYLPCGLTAYKHKTTVKGLAVPSWLAGCVWSMQPISRAGDPGKA